VTEGVTTAAVPVRGGRGVHHAIAGTVLGLGIAAGAAAITMLSMLLRASTAVGGSCADGDASLATSPCRSHAGPVLLLVVACALGCLLAVSWGAGALGAPTPLFLAWPALCLTLGWNFLRDGFDPSMGEDLALGSIVGGVVFLLLGVGPLFLRRSAVREERR
jgi:hypothetical protein